MPSTATTLELWWAAIVVPGLLFAIVVLGYFIGDEARRRSDPAGADPFTKLVSWTTLIIQSLSVIIHMLLVGMALIAVFTAPATGSGVVSPPSAQTIAIVAMLMAVAVIMDIQSGLLMVVRAFPGLLVGGKHTHDDYKGPRRRKSDLRRIGELGQHNHD